MPYPDVRELSALTQDELIERDLLVVVDWRAEEEEVVADFAAHLADGDSLDAEAKDGDAYELWVRYNGEASRLPLTESQADRYVTICSLASILSQKYEIRGLRSSLRDDTHLFMILTRADWAALERERSTWCSKTFEPLAMGIDGFHGGRVPFVGQPAAPLTPGPKKPWWAFWRR